MSGLTERGHRLITPEECGCDDYYCNICIGGLGICKWCNAAEIELEQQDCPGDPNV